MEGRSPFEKKRNSNRGLKESKQKANFISDIHNYEKQRGALTVTSFSSGCRIGLKKFFLSDLSPTQF